MDWLQSLGHKVLYWNFQFAERDLFYIEWTV